MKVYIFGVKDKFDFADPKPIDDFHDEMYHGYNLRGKIDNNEIIYVIGDEILAPLKLVKNVYNIGEIFMPGRMNVVVSSKLKDELSGLPNIKYHEVEYYKLFEYPFCENDFSFKNIKGYDYIPYNFAQKVRGNNRLKCKIDSFFEIISYKYKDIVNNFNNLSEYNLAMDNSEEFYIEKLGLSVELIEKHPILWCRKYIINEIVYNVLKPYFNPYYFWVKEFDLADDSNPKSKLVI